MDQARAGGARVEGACWSAWASCAKVPFPRLIFITTTDQPAANSLEDVKDKARYESIPLCQTSPSFRPFLFLHLTCAYLAKFVFTKVSCVQIG